MKFKKSILLIPVILLFIGGTIHIVNVFKMIFGNMPTTLWNIWVNISMLIINTSLLIGLVKKWKPAYHSTIVMFSLFSITQISSLIVSDDIKLHNVITVTVSSAACLVTAIVMLMNKNALFQPAISHHDK